MFNIKKGGFRGYFRFRYRCIPSIVSASVKPASISSWASLVFCAALHIHSSSFIICMILAKCRYLRVVL